MWQYRILTLCIWNILDIYAWNTNAYKMKWVAPEVKLLWKRGAWSCVSLQNVFRRWKQFIIWFLAQFVFELTGKQQLRYHLFLIYWLLLNARETPNIFSFVANSLQKMNSSRKRIVQRIAESSFLCCFPHFAYGTRHKKSKWPLSNFQLPPNFRALITVFWNISQLLLVWEAFISFFR